LNSVVSAGARPAQYLPVLIFAYRRPIHFSNCWRSLAENAEASSTDLHIFLDGPKNATDSVAVRETKEEARRIHGFKTVHLHCSDVNQGLSASIINGIGTIKSLAHAWIVLEDDIEVSPFFLKYMNEAVAIYRDVPEVASIHGYVYPIASILPETFFLKGADCWGWATWQAAWTRFEPDGKKLLEQLKIRGLEKEFDLGGVAPFTEMLKSQISGRNDSWAIRWHASAFLAGLHTLYPGRSLVKNTGLDNSGTHCGSTIKFDIDLSPGPVEVLPITVEESAVGRKAFQEFYESSK
jgi:hypothetical protein